MFKNSFGTHGQLTFNDEHEFYRFLGYLARSNGETSLVLSIMNNRAHGGLRDEFKYTHQIFQRNGQFFLQQLVMAVMC